MIQEVNIDCTHSEMKVCIQILFLSSKEEENEMEKAEKVIDNYTRFPDFFLPVFFLFSTYVFEFRKIKVCPDA